MEARTIVIPYAPRRQFVPFHDRSERWAKIVAHRRFGKTVGAINDLVRAALTNTRAEPPPRYAYVAPTMSQAKNIAWGYLRHYTAALPAIRLMVSELWVELPNAARIRLYGADNYDRMRGLYFDGVVIDEPADIDPRAWPTVIRPTLSDYGGWATFIGTPKGRNAFYFIDRDDKGRELPDWFRLTLKASETGILPAEETVSARLTLTPEQYAQEYECSFEAAVIGAYYGRLMADADREKRICGVPYDPAARVWTAWDLGFRDATAVWFMQRVGQEIHLIDYHESVGADIGEDVRAVLAKPYSYAGHVLPHDAWATEKQTGKTTAAFMEGLGIRDVQRAPDHRVEDGITSTQMVIPRCWFDAGKCARGIEALRLYRAEFDDKRQTLRRKPVHDWASHAADAFRYLAVTLDRLNDRSSFFSRKIEYPKLGIA